jgi:glyoxylase I family protein
MEATWHHVALSVRDLGAALRFYRDLLGFEVDWDMDHRGGELMSRLVQLPDPDVHMVMLKGYGTRLELFKYRCPEGEDRGSRRQCDFGLTHLAFSVQKIHDLYQRLRQAGVRFNCEPLNLRPGVWATYLQDPEGVTIELVEYGPGDLP